MAKAKKRTETVKALGQYRCLVACSVLNRKEERSLSLGAGATLDGDVYAELLERKEIRADMFEPVEATTVKEPAEPAAKEA